MKQPRRHSGDDIDDDERPLSRRGRRVAVRKQKQPVDSDFLEGRFKREDDEEETDDEGDADQEERIVTLPNHALTISEASALLRVKIDDIEQSINAMGGIESVASASSDDSALMEQELLLDMDAMELLAMEYGIITERSTEEELVVDSERLLMKQRRGEDEIEYPARPPVV